MIGVGSPRPVPAWVAIALLVIRGLGGRCGRQTGNVAGMITEIKLGRGAVGWSRRG
jgi:hypothetical protein